MTVNLAEPTSRCEWALRHATTVCERVLEFERRNDVFRPRFHLERDSGWFTVTVEPAPAPSDLTFMTGDILHNLRSALDHMVWQLAVANGNVPPAFPLVPGDPWLGLQFPIFSAESQYRANETRYLHGLSNAAKAFVEARQPFRDPKYGPLALLADLSNIDKHRIPHLAATIINRVDIVPDPIPKTAKPDQFRKLDLPAVIETPTEIAAMHFDPLPERAASYVGIGFAVAFDKASGLGSDTPILATLGTIGGLVQTIIYEAGLAGL